MYKEFLKVKKGNDYDLDLFITDTRTEEMTEVITREVVRGVILKGNRILLVYPKNEVIYGTPGGGIDPFETQEEALKRELKEEIGAEDITIRKYIGKMVSRRINIGGEGVFSPTHHYYLVDVETYGNQALVEYEENLELSFDFIDINKAINHNEKMLRERNQIYLDFYTNQVEVLKEIRRIFNLKD